MAGMAMPGKRDIADVPFEAGLINGQGRFRDSVTGELPTVKVKRGETIRLRLSAAPAPINSGFKLTDIR